MQKNNENKENKPTKTESSYADLWKWFSGKHSDEEAENTGNGINSDKTDFKSLPGQKTNNSDYGATSFASVPYPDKIKQEKKEDCCTPGRVYFDGCGAVYGMAGGVLPSLLLDASFPVVVMSMILGASVGFFGAELGRRGYQKCTTPASSATNNHEENRSSSPLLNV